MPSVYPLDGGHGHDPTEQRLGFHPDSAVVRIAAPALAADIGRHADGGNGGSQMRHRTRRCLSSGERQIVRHALPTVTIPGRERASWWHAQLLVRHEITHDRRLVDDPIEKSCWRLDHGMLPTR